MEITDLQMLLSDLTVEQFIQVLSAFFGFFIGFALICILLYFFIGFIFNLIHFCFRRDKYKDLDYIRLKSFRCVSSLRKQAENAPTETAYFLYYNRLLGALLLMTELGIISQHCSSKLFDVKRKNG